MFDSLGDKLEGVFKKLRGHDKLTEANMKDALRDVRLALLEADLLRLHPLLQHRLAKRYQCKALLCYLRSISSCQLAE